MGYLKIFIGTLLEMGQGLGTLAKVSQWAEKVGLIYFKRSVHHCGLSRRWDRGFFL